jgi:hypothetical protein
MQSQLKGDCDLPRSLRSQALGGGRGQRPTQTGAAADAAAAWQKQPIAVQQTWRVVGMGRVRDRAFRLPQT